MLRTKSIRALAGMAIGVLTVAGLALPASATPQGCTPGYWKNHTDSWTTGTYQPTTLVGDVFADEPASLSNWTLLQALQGGGGPGVLGASKILLRAATAALLNESLVGGYNATIQGILNNVSAAFRSGDRDTILDEAAKYDAKNNALGGCPLN